MSWLGIILLSVFSANAFLTYGFGSCALLRSQVRGGFWGLAALLAANFITTSVLWCLDTLFLGPLGIIRFNVVAFALIVVPIMKFLSHLAIPKEARSTSSLFSTADNVTLSCLVFGIALLATRRGYSITEGLLASFASVFGYAASMTLLDAIRRRMELSSSIESLRGGPALLLSAGLMAMAFSGIDTYLIANLAK